MGAVLVMPGTFYRVGKYILREIGVMGMEFDTYHKELVYVVQGALHTIENKTNFIFSTHHALQSAQNWIEDRMAEINPSYVKEFGFTVFISTEQVWKGGVVANGQRESFSKGDLSELRQSDALYR